MISATAIGLLFKLFYNYNGGMLNQILESIGAKPVNWLSPSLAFIMVCIPTLWSYIGFYFVILLTGLSDIPDDIYEAASIDGCSRFKQVFYITLPMMKPVFFTSVTLAVTGALKVFDLPWVMVPNGAPQGLTHFLGTYMYQQTFGLNNYDYGSTLAVLIVVLGIVVSKAVGFLTADADDKEAKSAQEQRKEGGGLNGCSSMCNGSQKKHRRIGAGTVVIYLVLIFWAVLTIFPFVWVVLNSFKPSAEVLRSSFSLRRRSPG